MLNRPRLIRSEEPRCRRMMTAGVEPDEQLLPCWRHPTSLAGHDHHRKHREIRGAAEPRMDRLPVLP
jgi:hypothetical protein